MSNILTVPVSGAIYFSDGVAGSSTIPNLSAGVALRYDNSAGLNITSFASAASASDRFSIDGASGRLFSVSDSLTGSIFSVNDAAGLPIIEVESNLIDKITMGTYGSNALVINDTKVGIGTATPAEKLSVVGNTTVTGYVSASQYFGLQSALSGAAALVGGNTLGTNLQIGTNDNFNLNLETAGSTRMTVTSAGNVGIGTTTAAAKLQIIHDGSTNPLDIRRDGFLGSQLFTISNLGDITGGAAVFTPKLGHMVPALTVTGNGTFPVAIFQTGNVGIGTSTPTAKLDIADTTLAGSGALSGSALSIAQTWNTTGNPTAITLNVTNSASGAASNLLDLQVGTTSKFKVGKGASGSANMSLGSSGGDCTFSTGGNLLTVGLGSHDVQLCGSLQVMRSNVQAATFFLGHNDTSTSLAPALLKDGNYILAQRNGVNPQTFRLYNTYTSSTNFERLNLRWDTNVLKIGTEKGVSGGTARDLVLETDGTERVRVLSTGNLGIGTITPQNKLDVNGDTRLGGWLHIDRTGGSLTSYLAFRARGASEAGNFGNAAGNGQFEINAVNGSGFVIGTSNGPVILASQNSERLRITTNGNVGIGTTNPQSNLEIYGATSTLTINTGDGSTTAGLRFAHRDSVYADSQIKVGIFAPAAGSFGLSTGLFFALNNATDNTNVSVSDSKLAILSNGNIGVGTTTPNERLTVSGNISSSNVVYALGGNSDLWNNTYTTVNASSANYILDGGNTKGANILVGTNDNFNLNLETAGSTRMTVTSAGAVGIGTANPLYTLDVNGAIGTSYNGIKLGDPIYSIDVSVANSIAYKSSLNHIFYGASTELMRIGYPGNLGLGTANPIAKLDIADTTLAGSGALSGSILNLAQTWNTTGNPTAIKLNVTNTASGAASNLLDLQVGTVSMFKVAKSGSITTPAIVGGLGDNSLQFIFGGNRSVMLGIGELRVSGTSTIGWSGNGTHADATAADLILVRDAANTLAQRRGVSPQAFRLYNTFTDTVSAFERLNIKWDANAIKIGTEKGITGGLGRAMEFQTDGTTRMTVTSSGNVGIGTTNPTSILHLRDGISTTLKIEGYSTGAVNLAPALSFQSNNNQGNYESARIEGYGYHPGGLNALDFYINNVSGVLNRMWRMDSSGNIVQNPGAYSADMPGSGIIFNSKATGGTGFRIIKIDQCASTGHPGESLRLQAGDANYVASGSQNFGGKIFIYGGIPNISGAAPKYGDVILAHNGTNAIGGVGVGTSTPTAKLDIADTTFAGSSALSGSALNITQTWNTTGNPTAFTLNVTNSASGSTSNLLDLQVGGSSKFKIDKDGITTLYGPFNTCTLKITQTGESNGFGPFGSNATVGFSNGTRSILFGYGGGYTDLRLTAGHRFGWTSDAYSAAAALDTMFTRKSAANIRLGDVDAAAPVAQTLSVQSVVAGTTNLSGSNFTITGSQGTGTGAGGSIIFQTAPAGSSGTAVNPLSTVLTINSTGKVGIGVTNPAYNLTIQTADTSAYSYSSIGILKHSSSAADGRSSLLFGGDFGNSFRISQNGYTTTGTNTPNHAAFLELFNQNGLFIGTGQVHDLYAQFSTAIEKRFSIYSTLNASLTNYERLSFKPQSGGAFLIMSEAAGTGSYRDIEIQNGGSTRIDITSGGNIGIGNTSPTEKLDVTGNVKVSGSIAAGAGTFSTTLSVVGVADVGGLTITDATPAYQTKNVIGSAGFNFFYNGQQRGQVSDYGLNLTNYGILTWASSGSNHASDRDLYLLRDAAGTFAQRNGVNPQSFRVYSTYTDASNYERFFISTNVGATSATQIGLSAAGTGQNRGLEVVTGGSTRVTVTSVGNVGIGTTTPTEKLVVNGSFSVYPNSYNSESRLITRSIHPDGRWALDIRANAAGGDVQALAIYNSFLGIGSGEFLTGAISSAIGISSNITHIPKLRIAGSGTGPNNASGLVIGSSSSTEWSSGASYPDGSNYYEIRTNLSSPAQLGAMVAVPTRAPLNIDAKYLSFLTGNTTGVEAMRIASVGNVGIGTTTPVARLDIADTTFAGSSALSGSALNITQTWNTTGNPNAITLNVTNSASGATSNLLNLQVGGNSKFKVSKGGSIFSNAAIGTNTGNPGADGLSLEMFWAGYGMGTNNNGDAVFYQNNVARTRVGFGVAIADGWSLGFTNASHVGANATVDTIILRDAAGTLAQRNGVNPQAFRLYNTYTDSVSAFERLNIKWDANVIKIGTEKGITGGLGRAMEFQTDGTTRMTVTSAGNVGIGTTNPTSLLHLRGGVSPTLKIEGFDAGATYLYPAISFHSNNSQGNYESARIEGYGYHPGGYNNLNFYINNGSGVLSRMWQMDSSGNIVQNPGASSADMPGSGIIFTSRATGGTGFRTIKITACASTGHPGESLRLQAGDANYAATGGLNFGGKIFVYGGKAVAANATPKDGDVILAHDGTSAIGGVGVGTSTPIARLDIADTTFAGSSALSGSALNITQTWNTTGNPTAIKLNVTNTNSGAASNLLDLQVGGVSKLYVDKSGMAIVPDSAASGGFVFRPGNSGSGGIGYLNGGGYGIWAGNGAAIGFSTGAALNGNILTALYTDAANTLAQRNGVNPQAFRLYNTFTDTVSAFERLNIKWDTNVLKIGTEKGSAGGTARAMELQTDGVTRAVINSNGITVGNLNINPTNSAIYNAAIIGFGNNTAYVGSPSDGVLRITNNALTSFNRLQFGGETASFPAIKRNGAALQIRLADDSANAALETAGLTVVGNASVARLDIADTTFAGSSALSGSALNITQTWNTIGNPTAIKLNVTNTASGAASNLLDLQVGGVSQFRFTKGGVFFLGIVEISSNAIYGAPLGWPGSPSWGGIQQLNMYSGSATTGFIQWNNDLFLCRDAANTLAQRNGVNPQSFRIYNTYTDASNYERFFISTNVGATSATQIGLSAAGTGQNRDLEFVTGGSTRMTILSGGNVGIGTTSPNERLTVVGTVSAAGDFAVATSLQGVILVSPNFTRWRITVNDNGTLQTTAL